MKIDKKQIPILISFLVSLVVLMVLWEFREPALLVVLQASFVVAIVLAIYFVVNLLSARLRKHIWLPAIVYAVIIYFGFLLLSLSLFKNLLSGISWDPTMAGLGIAVVAFAWVLFTQSKQPQTKETSEEIGVNVSALTEKTEALNEKFNKLESVIDAFLEEPQNLAQKINRIMKEDTSKSNQTKK